MRGVVKNWSLCRYVCIALSKFKNDENVIHIQWAVATYTVGSSYIYSGQ